MDAFKGSEIKRMQLGGNKVWQDYFNANTTGSQFADSSIKDRYESEAGEEYKERLTAKVEDREFDLSAFKKERALILEKQAQKNRAATAGRNSNTTSRTGSPTPAKFGSDPVQKARNEAYFEKMGAANADRPDGVAPSQGGKYGGFGSAPPEPAQQSGVPSANDFTADPVAALTRSFGWFGSTVAKQAKIVNESYIQPTAKNVSFPLGLRAC